MKMCVSWQVQRGKGSDAAPQGNGIWDHHTTEELLKGGPSMLLDSFCDVYLGNLQT